MHENLKTIINQGNVYCE